MSPYSFSIVLSKIRSVSQSQLVAVNDEYNVSLSDLGFS